MGNKIKEKSHGIRRKFLKLLRGSMICMIVATLLIIVAGVLYEKVGLHLDMKRYNVPGKMVEINGHDMHVFAEGSGSSTIVFVSGFGTPSPYVDFYPLYSKLSKDERVVVYERPGYGFSEVADTSRDIDTITKEMHEALEKSGEVPPYIFVAHSMGTLEAIRFAQLYQDEVEGIITIDGGNPNYYATEEIAQAQIAPMKLQSIFKNVGVMRLLFNYSEGFMDAAYTPRNGLDLVPTDLKILDEAMYLKTMTNENKKDEMVNLQTNAQGVVDHGDLGEIPLRILTAGNEVNDAKWKASQEGFKSWSTDSKQKVIIGSPHYIHQYFPEEVNNAIGEILKSSSGNRGK